MYNNKKDSIVKICPYGKCQELCRTLGKTGTLEILYFLEEEPKRYKDIDKLLDKKLSQSSLSRRLKILQNLNIIKQQPKRSERRDTHVYDFTLRGEDLMKFLKDYEKEIKLPLSQQKITKIATKTSK